MHDDHGGMNEMDHLADLDGEEFERAFLSMMIEHHADAVRTSGTCLRRAAHAELRDLCRATRTTQHAEIHQMEAWLCDWYGMCGRRHGHAHRPAGTGHHAH